MRKIGRAGLAVALGLALFVGAGIGLFRSIEPEPSGTDGPAPQAGALLAPAVGAGLGDTIGSLQARLRELPTDWRSFASLGLAYVQQARVTSDPSYYPKAEGVLRESLRLNDEDNYEALIGMAALAAARHDFAVALRYGQRAREINPYDGAVHGVIGDAQLELGRYDDAFATFQRMVDTEPNLASYARVSYARELRGDVSGAIEAMEAAREIAGTQADAAWASYQLGELYFNSGRIARASAEYRRGVAMDPAFLPSHAGLAKVAWAWGEVGRAIDRYTFVTQRYPSPEYVIALGDLYAAAGDREAAERQYDLVRVEERLFQASGVNVDLELALFEADHGDPASALRAAREEWRRRRSVHVADAMAWALYASGRYAEAAGYARRALALGRRNAVFLFHAGMIELELGRDDAARALLTRALRTNGYFSIPYAAVAERELAGLGGPA